MDCERSKCGCASTVVYDRSDFRTCGALEPDAAFEDELPTVVMILSWTMASFFQCNNLGSGIYLYSLVFILG